MVDKLIEKRRILIALKKLRFFVMLSWFALLAYVFFNLGSMNEEQIISASGFMYSLIVIFIPLAIAEIIFRRPVAIFLFERHTLCKCPFFGFVRDEKDFIDQFENTCTFNTNPPSPCLMKSDNQIPNWIECHFNNERERKMLSEICMDSSFIVKDIYFSGKLNFWEWFSAKVT